MSCGGVICVLMESIFGSCIADIIATRYHDTPVGTYDELLIVPGKFEVGEAGKEKEMLRVTRIYVSGRGTLWNGRHSIPSPSSFPSACPMQI